MHNTSEILMERSRIAARSAKILLGSGDTIGDYNRAYYAVFDAARAILISEDPEVSIKSHKGLISMFGQRFVKTGIIDRDIGKTLKRIEFARNFADYSLNSADSYDAIHAEKIIAEAEEAVEVIYRSLNNLDRDGFRPYKP